MLPLLLNFVNLYAVQVIASKIIKLVSLANDSPTNAETLLTLPDAAKTVVQ